MSPFKVTSVRLPAELVERIDAKAKAEGLTRQQLLAALIDMGLKGALWTDASSASVIGPLVAIRLLRDCQGTASTDPGWCYRHLRNAIWEHLTVLVGGGQTKP